MGDTTQNPSSGNPFADTLQQIQPQQNTSSADNTSSPSSANPFDDTLAQVTGQGKQQSAPGTVTGNVTTIGAVPQPKSTMGKLANWIDNVTADLNDGGDRTGVGTVMQKLGAHGLHNGNSAAVGDFMASLPLGLLKASKGGAEVVPSAVGGEKGNTWKGVKDLVGGGLQAIQMPAAFVTPEESALSKDGLLSDAATTASNAGGKIIDAAKGAETWVKANPIKAVALEGVARELGIDPLQLTSKVIKYGKGIFGDSK